MNLDQGKVLLYAHASQQAYHENGGNLGPEWKNITPPSVIQTGDGFQAVAYYNTQTGELIIAYRGTEDMSDIRNDAALSINIPPAQIEEAHRFYNETLAYADSQAYAIEKTTLTGHSLGGGIAQVIGIMTKNETYTFNAPGMEGVAGGLDLDIIPNYDNIHNIRSTFDPVSLWGEQVGNVYTTNVATGHGIDDFVDYLTVNPLEAVDVPQALWNLARDIGLLGVPVVRGLDIIDVMMDKTYMAEEFSTSFYDTFLAQLFPGYEQDVTQVKDILNAFITENGERFQSLYDSVLSLLSLKMLAYAGASNGFFSTEAHEAFLNLTQHINRDPLVLDLDGDGIETLGLSGQHSVMFDHDGDGIKTATGWIKGDDGILVRDLNNNGLIDNGGELFGVDTVLSNGKRAQNGFEALSDLDSNQDGMFNQDDLAFSSVKIWQDKNADGVATADELKSLSELGIQSINVTPQHINIVQSNGNKINAQGDFTWADGKIGKAYNMDFIQSEYDQAKYNTPENYELIHFNLSGTGYVLDLAQATYLSPALQAASLSLMGLKNIDSFESEVTEFIALWSETATKSSSYDLLNDSGYPIVFYPHDVDIDIRPYIPILLADIEERKVLLNELNASERELAIALYTYQDQMIEKIGILEAFNGQGMLTEGEVGLLFGGKQLATLLNDIFDTHKTYYGFPVNANTEAALFEAYDLLYQRIETQIIAVNRLQPYMESLEIHLADSGLFSLDLSKMTQLLGEKSLEDYVCDVALLTKTVGVQLANSGWNGWEILQSYPQESPHFSSVIKSTQNGTSASIF